MDDRRADVIMAAWNAAEAALRLVQVGNTNTQVTQAFGKIAADFNCAPVQGAMCVRLGSVGLLPLGGVVVRNLQSVVRSTTFMATRRCSLVCRNDLAKPGRRRTHE